jgi:hypothetical protein
LQTQDAAVQLRCLLFVDQPLRRRHDETEQRLTSKFSSFAGNDEPAISVVTKQPNSSARDRGQDELQGFIRRAERDHSSIRKISSASPGNEARSRCEADAMAVKLFCLLSLVLVGLIMAGVV